MDPHLRHHNGMGFVAAAPDTSALQRAVPWRVGVPARAPEAGFRGQGQEVFASAEKTTSLERDRIEWVKEWINQLPVEESRRRFMGEETYALLRVVCYESPKSGSGGKLRAG